MYLVEDTHTIISETFAYLEANYWDEIGWSELDFILTNGAWELTKNVLIGTKMYNETMYLKCSSVIVVLLKTTMHG